MPDEVLFPYPDPAVLGLKLDPKGDGDGRAGDATGTRSPSGPDCGPATRSRRWRGSRYYRSPTSSGSCTTPRPQRSCRQQVGRGGESVDLTLDLPEGWRRGDISWRTTTWDLRRMGFGGLWLEELDGRDSGRGRSSPVTPWPCGSSTSGNMESTPSPSGPGSRRATSWSRSTGRPGRCPRPTSWRMHHAAEAARRRGGRDRAPQRQEGDAEVRTAIGRHPRYEGRGRSFKVPIGRGSEPGRDIKSVIWPPRSKSGAIPMGRGSMRIRRIFFLVVGLTTCGIVAHAADGPLPEGLAADARSPSRWPSGSRPRPTPSDTRRSGSTPTSPSTGGRPRTSWVRSTRPASA